MRTCRQPAMPSLAPRKVAPREFVGGRYRLVGAQAKSLPGDSVNTSRRVSYQSNIPAVYLVQFASYGHGASFSAAWFRVTQIAGKVGKLFQSILKADPRVARNQRDAGLVVAERRDVRLCLLAPMNLHAIGPRLHAKVSSLREPDFLPPFRIKADPLSPAADDSICSTHPPALQ